jgi:outer membrane protein assembly factor BamD (BamD/ComL family)
LYISAITHHFSLNFKKQKERPFWQFVEEEFDNNQKSNAFSELKLFLKEFINSIWLSDKKLKKIENVNNLENFEELILKYKKRRNNSLKNFTILFLAVNFIHWVGFKYLA